MLLLLLTKELLGSIINKGYGGLAQLGERHRHKVEVTGSIPVSSTIICIFNPLQIIFCKGFLDLFTYL